MLTIEEIQDFLTDRKIPVVSRRTGVSAATLYSLIKGGTRPRYDTLKALSDYVMEDAKYLKDRAQ